MEFPHIVDLNKRFEGQGVSFVSIDGGQRPGSAETYLDELGVVHYVLNDADREVFHAYGVHGVPTTCMIDDAGRLMYRHLGFRKGDEDRYASEIEALLAWRPSS